MNPGLFLPLTLTLSLAQASITTEPELLVVIGVPTTLERQVRETVETLLLEAPAGTSRVVALAELDDDDPPRAAQAVALGAAACERLAPLALPLVCALISSEAFDAIPCAEDCGQLRAIVMDQPPSRQIAVATTVYPSLRRFGLLSTAASPDPDALPSGTSLVHRRFEVDAPLPPQLNATLATSDALLALPESTLFNRSNLHVLLLTAYGYAKPVIGFNRAYVRAGALISTCSTPEQILREALDPRTWRSIEGHGGTARARPPARFSIAENRSIARSLGLLQRVDIDPERTYTDTDFPS